MVKKDYRYTIVILSEFAVIKICSACINSLGFYILKRNTQAGFGTIIYYIISKDYHFQPNIYLLLFPFAVLVMAAQGLGLGLIVSALTTKYRDLTFLVTFGVQLFMYATPVIYPLSSAPAKYRQLIGLNPLSGVIETMRFGLLNKGSFTWQMLGYSTGAAMLLLLVGILIFNRVEKNFVDTV